MSKRGPSWGAETDWKVQRNDSVRSAVPSLLEELLIRGHIWKEGGIQGRRRNDATSRVRARGRQRKRRSWGNQRESDAEFVGRILLIPCHFAPLWPPALFQFSWGSSLCPQGTPAQLWLIMGCLEEDRQQFGCVWWWFQSLYADGIC